MLKNTKINPKTLKESLPIDRKLYQRLLQHPEWKKCRDRIIKIYNSQCQHCKRVMKEKQLNVHHKYYIPGKKPWEYPDESLILLCVECHKITHTIILKKTKTFWLPPYVLPSLIELIKEFRQSDTPEKPFEKILFICEPRIYHLVRWFFRNRYFNQPRSFHLLLDLEQTAILGLAKAILAFNLNESPKCLPSCIFYNIRCEIEKMYNEKGIDLKQINTEKETNYLPFFELSEDVICIISRLLLSKQLNKDDVYLLRIIYIENMPISEIFRIFGDRWGKSYITINKRVEKISRILRKEFEKCGFGND